MIVYTPIFHCAELQPASKGKITREVADTLHYKYVHHVLVDSGKEFGGRINAVLYLGCQQIICGGVES